MTEQSVPNSASVLQILPPLPDQPQFGRRAFGRQRRMSQATVVRNIVESILTHRELGQDRLASFYTPDPETQALVQAKLDSLDTKADTNAAMRTMVNPPDLMGIP